MTVSASITINATKAAVWATTTDIARFAELLSGVEKIEVVEKPATGLVGLKWKETRILFGKSATVEKWVTEAEENEYYKTRAEQDGFVFITTNRLSGSDGGVKLTGIHETQPQGFASKLKALPMIFFKGVIKKAILQDLNDIKAAIDQEPSPEELARRRALFDNYTKRLDEQPSDLPLRCPCCFFKTLDERGEYEICSVCFWEDDGQDEYDVDVVRGGPNGALSLTQARKNYRELGASEARLVVYVRPPQPEELPDQSNT